jgi:hypothetical protein
VRLPSGRHAGAPWPMLSLVMPPLDIPEVPSFDMPLFGSDPILVESCPAGPVVWANAPVAESPLKATHTAVGIIFLISVSRYRDQTKLLKTFTPT